MMPTDLTCEECDAELPSDAPEGLCPRCLVSVGLRLSVGAGDPSVPPTNADIEAGIGSIRHFGAYELLEEIARGGMGIIFKARQTKLDRIVALKMILAGQFASREQALRFRVEAEAAARLQHPNIVSIHETGEFDGQLYFSMDYVDGSNLGALVREKPLPAKRAAGYVKTIAAAIHYAHEQGILHRDLKPSNILIDSNDQPRVTDFGLAKRMQMESFLTVTGDTMGSPNFMPPEQAEARRGRAGRYSDVYSLGGVLFYLLTGRPPFVAESIGETLSHVLNTDPVSPRLLNPSVPEDIATICLKCLEKEPARRYHSAQQLAEELERFLNDEPIHARPVSPVETLWRWCRRKPVVASLSAATVLLLLTIAIGSPIAALRIDQERRRAEEGETTARENLYSADLSLAQQALADGNMGRARSILDGQRPKPGQPDLRGFEWRYLWGRTRGDSSVTLVGHSNVVDSVAISPDGRTILSSSDDRTVRLWDFDSRRLILTLTFTNTVQFVAFSPGGEVFAVASGAQGITLWNTAQRKPFASISGEMAQMAFSPKGDLLAFAVSKDWRGLNPELVGLWNYRVERSEATFPRGGGRVAFSRDGTLFAMGSSNGVVTVLDVASRQPIAVLRKPDTVRGMEFTPDGRSLVTSYVGDRSGTVFIWDLARQQIQTSLPGHTASVWCIAFSPDARTMATGSSDQTVRLWDTPTWGTKRILHGHGNEVWSAAFTPDGRTLVTGSKDETIRLWPLEPPVAFGTMSVVHGGFQFSPDGTILAVLQPDNHVSLTRAATGELISSINDKVLPLRFSPDGKALFTFRSPNKIARWDVAFGTVQSEITLRTEGTVGAISLSSDCKLAFTVRPDSEVLVWDAETGDSRGSLGKQTRVDQARASPDGRRFVTFLWKEASLWDLNDLKRRATLIKHKMGISSTAFSPDGRILAMGGSDSIITLWDTSNGKHLHTITDQLEGILTLSFSADGRTLASGTGNTVTLWNMATFREVAKLTVSDEVTALIFSADGRTLAVEIGGNQLQLLRAPLLAEIEAAEKLLPSR